MYFTVCINIELKDFGASKGPASTDQGLQTSTTSFDLRQIFDQKRTNPTPVQLAGVARAADPLGYHPSHVLTKTEKAQISAQTQIICALWSL